MNKHVQLEKAVEITKEYARSGGTVPLDTVLESLYKKLKELATEASSGE